jgi:hypothetical protein
MPTPDIGLKWVGKHRLEFTKQVGLSKGQMRGQNPSNECLGFIFGLTTRIYFGNVVIACLTNLVIY